MSKIWGFLRETKEIAEKAGFDADTGLCRTGLEEYPAVIYPETNDWIHDKEIGILNGKKRKMRPDYRSESLKLIVEIDGLPHYQNPENIVKDENNTAEYIAGGYKVVRIPYFIQLTNSAVSKFFGVNVAEPLFDLKYPSLGPQGHNTPAYICGAGISRMAKEFKNFPDQYDVNIRFLESCNNEYYTGVSLLKREYEKDITR